MGSALPVVSLRSTTGYQEATTERPWRGRSDWPMKVLRPLRGRRRHGVRLTGGIAALNHRLPGGDNGTTPEGSQRLAHEGAATPPGSAATWGPPYRWYRCAQPPVTRRRQRNDPGGVAAIGP